MLAPGSGEMSRAARLPRMATANMVSTNSNFPEDAEDEIKNMLSNPHGRLGLCENFGLKASLNEITYDLKNKEHVRSPR